MSDKPFLLFIDSGFKFNIENLYQHKCELISRSFSGQIITYGSHGDYRFADIAVTVFKTRIPPKALARYLLSFFKLYMTLRSLVYSTYFVFKRKLNGERLDLIITYDPLTTGILGSIVSAITRVPLIVEVNGDYTAWSNYAHIGNKTLRGMRRSLAIKIQRFVFRRATGIKILYREQLDLFAEQTKDKIVKVYPNYLNVKEFQFLSERKVVSIVGFPFVVKGIDIAIAAFKKIADKHPDWSLEILGFYPYWEAKLIEKHMQGHVQIKRLEPIDRNEMPRYIGETGIVLCASRTEGFPRVIKEAMQSSKPCLASDVGGLRAAFEEESNGLIFESENEEELAQKLDKLIADPELRSRLGKNAKKFAEREYSDEAFLRYLSEFYSAAIEKSK